MSAQPWQQLTARFEGACRDAGLDLVHPFALCDFNRAVPPQDRLADFGRERALAILVANTRALWAPFQRAWQADSALPYAAHPLDTYVTSRVEAAVAAATSLAHHSHFSHVTTPRAVPIQRAAELCGFAALSPSHLAIHPLHGPWIALRAIVVLDCEGPPQGAPPLPHPCAGCARPCVAALERALAASGPKLDLGSVSGHAADWIAVRDVCPLGRASRYEAEQLRYHYGVERRRPAQGS